MVVIGPTPIPRIDQRAIMQDGRWNPVWYKYLKSGIGFKEDDRRIADDLGNAIIDISGLSTDIDGIHAQWGVQVSINNQVIGMVKLDGSASGSTFVVVANKFVVAHPSAPGTTITAFVVGLVNGVSTVGINGDLLVDGTILARSLSVSTLSAITANVGTLTAGLIRSSDSKVQLDLTNGVFSITT